MMKQYLWLIIFLLPLQLLAQDTTAADPFKSMDEQTKSEKRPVKIFQTEKVINANSTETTGRGKMNFRVSHSFDDIVRNSYPVARGGIKDFYGLDNSTDIRIGFHIGLTDRLDLSVARAKGDGVRLRPDTLNYTGPGIDNLPNRLFEIGLKYQIARQLEDDPSHPIAVSIFFSNTISAADTNFFAKYKFKNLGDRMSQVYQLILAKKIKKISLQVSPTLVHHGYTPVYDEPTTFAIGAAARVPVTRNFAILIDYFHSFLTERKKNNYKGLYDVEFHEPIGVGFEITTPGHVFNLNFTNNTSILESQYLSHTTSSWGKGQFRWAFTISRKFTVWRPKK